jgi:hypothetical protein
MKNRGTIPGRESAEGFGPIGLAGPRHGAWPGARGGRSRPVHGRRVARLSAARRQLRNGAGGLLSTGVEGWWR